MSSQNVNKKEENTKTRFHGLALSNQGRGIKSQSIAFQNSKWSNINRKSRNNIINEENIPGMTTVYVGRIPSEISDVNIRKLLNECGNIMRWNRSEDPTTKQLSSFGLCEFDSPEGVINAVNVLNGIKILGNRLLVKYQHGIDKFIAKWQSNRINEMLKQRGGDCTIETILNEFSNSDSKLRASIQRLLIGMSYEFELQNNIDNDKNIKNDKNNSQDYEKNKYVKYIDKKESFKDLFPSDHKQHPKEILRIKRFDEINKKFDYKMNQLNDEIKKLLIMFPNNMNISDNFTHNYLIDILEETFYQANFYPINKYNLKFISDIIKLDQETTLDFDSSSKESNSDFERDYNDDNQEDNKGINLYVEGINNNISQKNNSIIFQNTSNKEIVNINESKLTINIPFSKNNKFIINKLHNKDNYKNLFVDNEDNYSFKSNSLNTEVLLANNWKNVLENIDLEIYRNYIFQDMKRIIGESDPNALETIVDFVINNLNIECNIQDTIDILEQVLDKETESFLKGLFMKIIDS